MTRVLSNSFQYIFVFIEEDEKHKHFILKRTNLFSLK